MKIGNGMLAVIGTAMLAGAAAGQTIVDWDLQGQAGSQASVAANSAAANITGDTLARGAGLTGTAAANSISASGWDNLEATDYFSFGFTVDGGFQVDLASLYIGTRSSNTGPGMLGLFYSGDGFTGNLFTFNQTPGSNFVNTIVDLSALPNLSGAVEFRIRSLGGASANGGSVSGNGTFRLTAHFASGTFDRNMQLTGTVIPSPGSATLAAVGIAAMGMRSRRR